MEVMPKDGHKPTIPTDQSGDPIAACYNECYKSADCVEFTLLSVSGGSECYLFNAPCVRINGDPCVSQGCCVSGPRNCANSPVKSCPKLVYSGSEYMTWQCINNLGEKCSTGKTN